MSYLVLFCSCVVQSFYIALRLPRLGKRELIRTSCFSYVWSICACLDLSVSSSYWCLGRAAVCDCGTPWTVLLPFFGLIFLLFSFSSLCDLIYFPFICLSIGHASTRIHTFGKCVNSGYIKWVPTRYILQQKIRKLDMLLGKATLSKIILHFSEKCSTVTGIYNTIPFRMGLVHRKANQVVI